MVSRSNFPCPRPHARTSGRWPDEDAPLPPAAASERSRLVLDLSDVDFLTAAGVGELVALHARLRDLGGELVLDNVGQRAFEVLAVAGLADVLNVRRAGLVAEGCLPTEV